MQEKPERPLEFEIVEPFVDDVPFSEDVGVGAYDLGKPRKEVKPRRDPAKWILVE
ncbi:MAG: hypothetical protein ACE5M4_10065 [Anaerolineales bacterium]